MRIPSTIQLSCGPALIPGRPSARVILNGHELHTLATALAREAAEARAEGRHEFADRLDWRVADLRETAR